MTEEILKNFEARRAEILKSKEGTLSPEEAKEILREAVSQRIQTTQPPSAIPQQAIIQKAQQIKNEPKERQVELLKQMAFEKGVVEAVEVAKNLNNPYLLDEFHDALIDELYNQLVADGKIEQI